ncbi:MAG: hypothetical protein HY681_05910 [Chloroflexi bacterium]|nr:hypothetical protein [Chloroflexota bacterium]
MHMQTLPADRRSTIARIPFLALVAALFLMAQAAPCQKEDEDRDQGIGPQAGMSYAHVAPGQYSEVYMDIPLTAGDVVTATLSGPGVVGEAKQSATSQFGGTVRLTWRINKLGEYKVDGRVGKPGEAGKTIRPTVVVEG